LPAFLAVLALSASCAQTPEFAAVPTADATCVAGSAQLQISDGYQQILCGCKEAGGQPIGSGQGSATCTVPVGTQVFFYYLATHLKHQIMPADGVSFPASSLSDPSAKPETVVHAFQLTAAGTFPYIDAFDAGISGQIIAQ
jgi:hypothetical protein